MPFKKNNNLGNRFSSENQPKKNGRKKANEEISAFLEEYGIDVKDLPREQMEQAIMAPLFLSADKAAQLSKDKKAMMLLRVLSKELFGRNGLQVIRDVLDRIYGKPKQQQDITTNGKDIGLAPSLDNTYLLFPDEDE